MFTAGCKTDMKEVQSLTDTTNYPEIQIKGVEFIHTDSARLQLKVIAPELLKYSDDEEPYIEFPSGIEVFQYDDSLNIAAKLKADYAIYYEDKNLWKAMRNVVGFNKKDSTTLYTDLLFWDPEKEKIYTDADVKIVNADAEIYGEGLNANQDFSNMEVGKSTGEYYFNESDLDK